MFKRKGHTQIYNLFVSSLPEDMFIERERDVFKMIYFFNFKV